MKVKLQYKGDKDVKENLKTLWFKNVIEVSKPNNRYRLTLTNKRKRWIKPCYEVKEVYSEKSDLPFGEKDYYDK